MVIYWKNKELISRIRSTYKSLKSIHKTAKALDINRKSVSKYCNDLIPYKRRQSGKIRYPNSVKSRARELYKRIGSIHKVAKITKVDASTINIWVGDIIPKYSKSKWFKFTHDVHHRLKARKLYKKLGNVYKVAQTFGASPNTISTWVKDMIPIAQTKEEKVIENLLIKNNLPYNKVRLQGYSHICIPDFTIPPENPKIVIEIKKNGSKYYQQWHRMCSLLSRQMAFCSIDLKKIIRI